MLFWVLGPCAGQETPATSGEDAEVAAADEGPAPVQQPAPRLPGEVPPEMFLLPDKEGKLQQVLGFRLEDFQRLFHMQAQLTRQADPPPYTLAQVKAAGSAANGRAELLVEYTVVTGGEARVRVPLRLAGAIVQEVQYAGPGRLERLHYEESGDGYTCWLRGAADERHVVSVQALVPLASLGGETQLRLDVPRAALSELTLRVLLAGAIGRVADTSELAQTVTPAAGQTQFTVLGLGPDCELAWRPPDVPTASVPVALEASGNLLVRIDGRSVNTEARLAVRSFGGQFDQFRLRLPPGASLVGAAQPGVQFVAAGEMELPSGATARLYDVKLDKRTAGPVEVRLVTERSYNVGRPDEWLELAGFEVVGAVRQWGYLGVQVVGTWQLLWGPRQQARQVDELPDPLRREDLAGRFEYYSQPCSLQTRIVEQKTRVRVQPEYVFLVEAGEVRLRARLKCSVRGAKVRSIPLELAGWTVDEVTPANLVQPDAELVDDRGTLTIPLAQAAAGEFELVVAAHRATAGAAGPLELALPLPLVDTVAPATVVVSPADNVELAPVVESLVNLRPQSARPSLALPPRQQEPQVFQADAGPARYVAQVRLHAQQITAELAGRVELDELETRVEERLQYAVRFEPADRLLLAAPIRAAIEQLEVSLDGQKLAVPPMRSELDGEADLVPLAVALPTPRIGPLELVVRYLVRHPRFSPEAVAPVAVPLLVPSDAVLVRNRLTVEAPAHIDAALRKGAYEAAGTATGNGTAALSVAAKDAAHELLLAVTRRERQDHESTVVERAWLQTYFADERREDRACWRLTTNRRELRCKLPSGTAQAGVAVTVDGASAAGEFDAQGQLSVALPGGVTRSQHVLEVAYAVPAGKNGDSRSAEPPQIVAGAPPLQTYWQIVLPSQEHLCNRPAGYALESRWVWQGLYWSREPAVSGDELAAWVGASRGHLLPTTANQYVVSAVGAAGPLELWTVRRSVLVFVASLAVLAAGLVFIYLPAARRAGLLFVLAIGLAAAAAAQPDAAVLLAHAAALGLALVVVAMFLARGMHRAPWRATPVHGSSRALVTATATGASYRGALAGANSSTATAPTTLAPSPGNAPP